MHPLFHHLAFTFRMMGKNPAITLLSIMVLAFGVAGVSSIFNLLDGVMLGRLPYQDPQRMLGLLRYDPQQPQQRMGWTTDSWELLQERITTLHPLVATVATDFSVDIGTISQPCQGAYVSWNFTEMLGVQPIRGRAFTDLDASVGAPPVVLINERIWKEDFQKDPDIIGQTLKLDGLTRTIVGVLPKNIEFPFYEHIWAPLNTATLQQQIGWLPPMQVAGRLRDGFEIEDARAEVESILSYLDSSYTAANRGVTAAWVEPYKEHFREEGTQVLFLGMFLCSLLILLMACGIVSNLITAATTKRTQEMAIRGALGATRKELIAQFLAEGAILSLIALFIGRIFMEWFEASVLNHYYAQFRIPQWMLEGSGSAHFILVGTVFVLVTLGSSLLPALQASRTDLESLLRDSTRTGSSLRLSRMGKFLIIWQVGTACAILAGGSIVAYFLYKAQSGFEFVDSHEFLYARVSTPGAQYPLPEQRIRFYEQLMTALDNHPEIETAVLSTDTMMPFFFQAVEIEGEVYARLAQRPLAYKRIISAGYFEKLGIPLLRGREFTATDTPDKPRVAVVTDVFAKEHWNNEDPLGQNFRYDGMEKGLKLTVVGVVPDLFRSVLSAPGMSGFFQPQSQEGWLDMGVHLKPRAGSPFALAPTLTSIINQIDPEVHVKDTSLLADQRDRQYLNFRFIFAIFLVFALGSLLMAAAGLFGVIAFAASQRRREIGIRQALGASPEDIASLLFKEGLRNVGIGFLLGLLGTLLIREILRQVFNPLYESILFYGLFFASLLLIALAAIWVPAWLASREEPAEALEI